MILYSIAGVAYVQRNNTEEYETTLLPFVKVILLNAECVMAVAPALL